MIRMRSAIACLVTACFIAACGGGGEKTEAPKAPAATTPPAAAPAAPAPTAQPGAAATDDEIAPLLAWADSDVDEGKAPLTVKFMADVEGGKPPLTYKWTFGDGKESTEPNPVHVYEKAGRYQADLEVKDSSGDEDADYLEIEVE
jgi:PKD repeat protein